MYLHSIRNNQASRSILGHVSRSTTLLANTMERLSSGMRVNGGKDDAAALQISTRLTADANGRSRAIQNQQQGISLASTADSGLSSLHEMLMRMKELATQARNGTYSASDIQAMDKAFQSLKHEFERTVNNTRYNGISLLNVAESPPISPPPPPSAGFGVVDLSRAASITIWEETDIVRSVTFSIDALQNGVLWNRPKVDPDDTVEKYVFSIDLSGNTFTSTALYENGPDATHSHPANNIRGVRINGLQGYSDSSVYASVLYDHHPGPFFVHPLSGQTYGPSNALGPPTGIPVFFRADLIKENTFLTFQFQSTDNEPPPEPPSPVTPHNLFIHHGPLSNERIPIVRSDVRTETLGLSSLTVDDDTTLYSLDQAIDTVSKERSRYGQYIQTFSRGEDYSSNMKGQTEQSRQRMIEADMAKEASELTRIQLSLQMNTSLMTRSLSSQESIVRLLES